MGVDETEKGTAAATAAKSLQSCPTLCDPIGGSHQAPPSLGFSRQEHWSGLPFPSPMRESEVAQSCLTLSDPIDCSPRGSSVHGIFQARVLEWGAIAFSGRGYWGHVNGDGDCKGPPRGRVGVDETAEGTGDMLRVMEGGGLRKEVCFPFK